MSFIFLLHFQFEEDINALLDLPFAIFSQCVLTLLSRKSLVRFLFILYYFYIKMMGLAQSLEIMFLTQP